MRSPTVMADESGFPPPTPPEITPPSLLAKARRLVIDLSPLKRNRQFRLLWIGESVSDLGSRVTAVAVPYQVYVPTRSSLAVGLLALCELIPLLTLSVIGGAIADRVERRRLLQVTYGVLPLFSLVLAYNAHLRHPQLWVLYVFATLFAASYAPYSPAVRSAPPLLFSKRNLSNDDRAGSGPRRHARPAVADRAGRGGQRARAR